MVADKRVSRSIKFQMTGVAERKGDVKQLASNYRFTRQRQRLRELCVRQSTYKNVLIMS